MIKNLDDFLSALTLVLLTFYGLGIFVWSVSRAGKYEEDSKVSRLQLLKDYIDNTEE